MEIEKIDHKKRITNDFHLDKNEKPINKGAFNKCKIDTECIITADESEYIGKYNDIEEWPEKWLRKE